MNDKNGHLLTIKVPIIQKDMTIINLYATKSIVSNIETKLDRIEEENGHMPAS